MRSRLVTLVILSVLAFAGASSSSLHLLGQWNNMGRAPIAASPDGKYLAVTRHQSRGQAWIQVFQAENMRGLYRVRPDRNERANVLTFSPDGQYLYSGHTGATIYAARDGKFVRAVYGGSDGVPQGAIAFMPSREAYAMSLINTVNQSMFYLADAKTHVQKWVGPHDPPEPSQSEPSNWIRALAFSPDGKYLASGSGGGGIILWDVKARQRLRHLNDAEPAQGVLFPPLTAAMKKGWTAHASSVVALGFLSSTTLISGSADGTVKLWDVATGRLITQKRFAGRLLDLRTLPDGRAVALTWADLNVLEATPEIGVLIVRQSFHSRTDTFTGLSVTPAGDLWTMTQNGTLAHWRL